MAGHLDNQASGLIASTGSAQVTAATLDNRGGVINATGPLQASVQQGLDNRGGKLVGAGDLGIQAQTLDNRAAGIVVLHHAPGGGHVAHRESRRGTLQGGDVVLANAGLDNAQGTVLGASVTVDTRQSALDNTGGTLASTRGDVTIASGALTNTGGLLPVRASHARGYPRPGAGQYRRWQRAGGILSGGAGVDQRRPGQSWWIDSRPGAMSARAVAASTTSGQLGGNANVDINAAALGNGGGKIQAGRT